MTKFTCPTCQSNRFRLSMHEDLSHESAPRKTLPSGIKWNTFVKNSGETTLTATCYGCCREWTANYPINNLRKVMAKEGALG